MAAEHGHLHREEQDAARRPWQVIGARLRRSREPFQRCMYAIPVKLRPRAPAASDAQQAVSPGPDAGAAACLQPDLHRLRPDSRVRIDDQADALTLEQCLARSDECGAPVVSICGGEPMLYPEIGQLVPGLLDRGRRCMLCTNGMFIRKKIAEFKPHHNFFFNVHLDGMEKNHDLAVEREGVFDAAIDGIKAAKEAGFLVCTNTTVYRETDMNEIWQLFELPEQLGVDTHPARSGYGYAAVTIAKSS